MTRQRRSTTHRTKLWYRVYRTRIAAGLERCRHCATTGDPDNPLTFDHLQALADGGTLCLDNATILCRTCNLIKGADSRDWWPHLRSLAEEEAAAPPDQRWYVLAVADSLREMPKAFAYRGVDGCAITLTRRRSRATCVACPLRPHDRVQLDGVPAVLGHIGAHRDAGDHVPDWVDQLVSEPRQRPRGTNAQASVPAGSSP